MRAMAMTMRHELIGLAGVVERNVYLTKRYFFWDVAFFVWTVANTLTIVFIAEGFAATGGEIDVQSVLQLLGAVEEDGPLTLTAATARPPLVASQPASMEAIPNNHLFYALQWFFFAAAALVRPRKWAVKASTARVPAATSPGGRKMSASASARSSSGMSA